MIIGLTGGIASGKSTVSTFLKELGAYIIDCDMIAHLVVRPGLPAWTELVDHFGSKILNDDNSINRKLLGDIVFSTPEERITIEKIIHPRVKSQVIAEIELAKRLDFKVTVLDTPLLFEANWLYLVDQIWVVYVNESEQIARLIKRNNLTNEQAKLRVKNQMNLDEKASMADVIIDNRGEIGGTKAQVFRAWQKLMSLV